MTGSVIMLQLSKWYHRWGGGYHICYGTKIGFHKHHQFTKKNLVYKNHKVFPHIYTKFQNYSTKQSSLELISIKKETINIYEPKVALEDKIYLETYYRH